jgi:hypothetical protein
MAAKKLDDQQIQHRIEVLDALVQSGQSTGEFAQTQGMTYAQLRGWQAHGARWRAQQAAQRPSTEPDQPQVESSLAKPTLACEFVQAQVVAVSDSLNHPSLAYAQTNGHLACGGGGAAADKSLAVGALEPKPIAAPLKLATPSHLGAYLHDPPNPATHAQIICTQGSRSAVVNWPSTAALECAQWLKAYLA